jgi:hypothetical protein
MTELDKTLDKIKGQQAEVGEERLWIEKVCFLM